jgi:hypothetical protein
MTGSEPRAASVVLSSDDLIDDRSLESSDDDLFGASDVAAELAQLARAVRTPTNIVLFGAWGSGKSSVKNLLKLELTDRKQQANVGVRFACVDAFKFTEVPLRRHFISQVVGSLELSEKKYRKKLYEQTKHVELRLGREELQRALQFFVLFAAVALAITFIYASLKAWIGPGRWSHEFHGELSTVSASVLVTSALVGVLVSFIGQTLTTDTTTEAPSSEEQFERVFCVGCHVQNQSASASRQPTSLSLA